MARRIAPARGENTDDLMVAERLTKSGEYWAEQGRKLMVEADAAAGLKGGITAKCMLIKEARGCFALALAADKAQAEAEITKLKEMSTKRAATSRAALELV